MLADSVERKAARLLGDSEREGAQARWLLLCHLTFHPSFQPEGQCDSHSGGGLSSLILHGNPSQTYSVWS